MLYLHGKQLKLGQELKNGHVNDMIFAKVQRFDSIADELKTVTELLMECQEFKKNNADTVIFKLYLIYEDVTLIAKCMNELGYRITTDSRVGKRKYSPNDITQAIINKNAKVKEPLKSIVQRWRSENNKPKISF